MYRNSSPLYTSIVLHVLYYLLESWYMGTFDTVDNPQPYAWAMYVSKSVPLYRISKD